MAKEDEIIIPEFHSSKGTFCVTMDAKAQSKVIIRIHSPRMDSLGNKCWCEVACIAEEDHGSGEGNAIIAVLTHLLERRPNAS